MGHLVDVATNMDSRILTSIVAASIIETIQVDNTDLDRPRSPPVSHIQADRTDRDRGQRWVAEVLANDVQLLVESRLRRIVFEELTAYLRAHGSVDGRLVSVEEQLLIFLYICGNGSSYRNVMYRCGRSLDTISQLV